MSEQNTLSQEQDLRLKWQELNRKVEKLEKETEVLNRSAGLVRGNVSRVEKLRRQVNILMIVCFLCPTWVVPVLRDIGCPLSLCVFTAIFFLIMGFLKFLLCRMLGKVDFGSNSVCDTLRQMERIVIFRSHSRWIGWLLAIPILIAQFMIFWSINAGMVWGGVAGLITGLFVGLSIDRRASRLLNEIRDTLSDTGC